MYITTQLKRYLILFLVNLPKICTTLITMSYVLKTLWLHYIEKLLNQFFIS